MKQVIASAISAASVALCYWVIYLTSPKDPEYAGSGFSWTITHFLPAMLLTMVASIAAIVVHALGRKDEVGQDLRSRLLSLVLLMPFAGLVIHVGWRLAPLVWIHR